MACEKAQAVATNPKLLKTKSEKLDHYTIFEVGNDNLVALAA